MGEIHTALIIIAVLNSILIGILLWDHSRRD